MAEKKISPKAAASKETKDTSKAATRVTKRKAMRKLSAKKQRVL